MSNPDNALERVEAFCRQCFGSGEMNEARKLSGGASMESWYVEYNHRPMVLRRRPEAQPENRENVLDINLISLGEQAMLMHHVHERGILAPPILGKTTTDSELGECVAMGYIAGESLPNKLLANPQYQQALEVLGAQCAQQLASIHSTAIAELPLALPAISPADALREQEQFYRTLSASNAVIEMAFGWLEEQCPPPVSPCLVHGDFRMGNFLIDHQGLTAVLDWELAHLGDPIRDVAYMCTPSWRFGQYSNEAGGFTSLSLWIHHYEAATGQSLDRSRFEWWMVFNCLWWGVTCLRLGQSYRDKSVRTVERAVIGRRLSEVEIDLLLMLEPTLIASLGQLTLPESLLAEYHREPPGTAAGFVQAEVSHADIAQAVLEWLGGSVIPESSGHALFEARVARNALGIAQRALRHGSYLVRAPEARLQKLRLNQAELCAQLRTDSSLRQSTEIWRHMCLSSLERLLVDQPRYAGLAVALARWT